MQQRALATRERLLRAAAEIFAANGYAGTSLTEIHERAGVTKGAIYFHYPNKESVAEAIVERQLERWPALVKRFCAEESDPVVVVVALTFAITRAFRDEPVMRAGARLALDRNVGAWEAAFTQVLEPAERAGELAEGVTAEKAARVVVSSFFGVFQVSDTLGRADTEERLREMWRVVLFGIQAEPSPRTTVRRAEALALT